jgi:hypothetical protein
VFSQCQPFTGRQSDSCTRREHQFPIPIYIIPAQPSRPDYRLQSTPEPALHLPPPAATWRDSSNHPGLSLSDLDIRRAGALVALRGHDHVVPFAEVEVALALPLVKVLARVDDAAGALLAADRPVLVKGGGALDGRLVDAARLVDVVGAAVVFDGAEPAGARRRVVRAVRLDDVVLDERVGGPAVQGEVWRPWLASVGAFAWVRREGRGG